MIEIWSRWEGEPKAFIFLTILHILLYVRGERSNSTDRSLNFGIRSGIANSLVGLTAANDFLKDLGHFCLSNSASIRDGISINFLQ